MKIGALSVYGMSETVKVPAQILLGRFHAPDGGAV
jgi:hypothetical protein